MDTINIANLVKIAITAKNKKIPEPKVVIAPEIIEIPISCKASYILVFLSL